MRSIKILFSDTWEVFRNNLNLFLNISVVPAATSFLVDMANFLEANIFSIWLLTLVSIIISIMASIALILAVYQPKKNDFLAAYNNAGKYFWAYLGLGIVILIVTVIGFVALIIPGIIFMIWFIFGYLVLILEDKKIIESMKASREYVRGYWWKVFSRFIFLSITLILVSLLLGLIVVGIIFSIFGNPSMEITTSVIVMLTTMFIAPFGTIYWYLVYKDLKSLKSEDKVKIDKNSINEE